MFYRLMVLLGLVGMLGACNTVSGIGKDVGAAGEVITDTAEETKEEITK